jgi:hypothetical protein
MSPIMWSQRQPPPISPGGGVVETLQDWWFIIGFTTLKPIIQRFQSFLFILIFPIYKWALDFTVFGRTAWGFVCNLRAGYWHQLMSRVDMNRDSQVNYQASLCLHSAGYIMSWSVDPGIQSPCHDRDSVTVPVCAAKNIPGSQVGMLPEDRKNQAQPWFFGEWLIITSC